jgi:hypothetical protein
MRTLTGILGSAALSVTLMACYGMPPTYDGRLPLPPDQGVADEQQEEKPACEEGVDPLDCEERDSSVEDK